MQAPSFCIYIIRFNKNKHSKSITIIIISDELQKFNVSRETFLFHKDAITLKNKIKKNIINLEHAFIFCDKKQHKK